MAREFATDSQGNLMVEALSKKPILNDPPTLATLGEVHTNFPPDCRTAKSVSIHAVAGKPQWCLLCLELYSPQDTTIPEKIEIQYEIKHLAQTAQSLLRLLDPSIEEQILEELKRIQSG